jgi:hypothetical protein
MVVLTHNGDVLGTMNAHIEVVVDDLIVIARVRAQFGT